MDERIIFDGIIIILLLSGIGVFILLFFITAPYGRHIRRGWGPGFNNKLSWIIMEAFPPIVFCFLFFIGEWKTGLMPYVFLFIWMFHYLYRAFLYPLRIRGEKTMPLSILFFGVIFNSLNAYIQGRYLYFFSSGGAKYTIDWITTPQFITGTVMFFIGFAIHFSSDSITRNLRKPGGNDYHIPLGGFFNWVSCPNYLGEIIQWTGWAVLTWSVTGFVFAFWTAANLMPRAKANHTWYREQFDEYPEERKALIPFLF